MRTKLLFKIATILLFLGILSACEVDLIERPPHLITAETLFNDFNGLETGIDGLYALARRENGGRDSRTSQRLMSGSYHYGNDIIITNFPTSGFSSVSRDWGGRNHSTSRSYWRPWNLCYDIINSANTVISRAQREGVDFSGGRLSPADEKNRIIAEARALRALQYRHLTFGWGDVPLNLEETTGANIRTDWERTPIAEVRQQILEDLMFAQEHLGVEGYHSGRLTRGAVQHYIAEWYLVADDPENALFWANKVMETPEYQLVTERYGVNVNQPGTVFTDMFLDGNQNREWGNTEALWVHHHAYQTAGGGGDVRRRVQASRHHQVEVDGQLPFNITYERGGRGSSRVTPTTFYMNLFEPQDDRFSEHAIRKFLIFRTDEENTGAPADRPPPGYDFGDTIWLEWDRPIDWDHRQIINRPYVRKFSGVVRDNVGEMPNYNDQIYLRLADTYLLKAEAEYKLGRPEDAAETINIIRRRSNASDITAADVDIDFILDERARELYFEEQRNWTLRRTGKWMERSKAHNGFGFAITERDLLYPIPQTVIDGNVEIPMPQNPGY